MHENNHIRLDDKALVLRPFRYLMMHKTANRVCSNVDEAYPSIFSESGIEQSDELHVVGRLDADTTGLVLVTDDGRWSFNITRPNRACAKVYEVGVRDAICDEAAQGLARRFKQGIELQNQSDLTLPAGFERLEDHLVRLSIVEGKFHQVKQMFAAVGNRVVSLHRCQIGQVALDVTAGQWRHLTADEVASFDQYMRDEA